MPKKGEPMSWLHREKIRAANQRRSVNFGKGLIPRLPTGTFFRSVDADRFTDGWFKFRDLLGQLPENDRKRDVLDRMNELWDAMNYCVSLGEEVKIAWDRKLR